VIRRIISSMAALASAAVLLPFWMPAAQAAGSCTLHAPTRVAIGRPYIGLTMTMSGDCANGGWGAWDLYHPTQGLQDIAFFDGQTTDVWNVYDYHTIGLHTWRPAAAYDGASNPVTQNTVNSDVRLAAGAWISSSRSGAVVTLKGTSLLYSTSTDKYFKRSAGGVFQYRERGTTTWRNLKSVWTSSAGEVTMKYTYSKVRDYRFALYSTPISWDLGSAVTTR
jgi:hypothetical protein